MIRIHDDFGYNGFYTDMGVTTSETMKLFGGHMDSLLFLVYEHEHVDIALINNILKTEEQ